MLNTEKLCPGCMNDAGGEQVCPMCGFDSAQKNDSDKLPIRFWLSERYMIGKVLSVSSEGVTYLGWDNIQNIPVNIKEYFPSNVAYRNDVSAVAMDVNHKFAFNEGLMAFMELNTKLMSMELPALAAITDVFEENGTAYSISPVIAGITLAAFLERNGGTLKWEQIRPLLLPLIDTIKSLHEERIIHGGISPETIIVGRDGKLKLTGFSIISTRCAGGEIPAQVYSGYAAAEQYGVEGFTIGAYTDVYGLSATLFRVIIGTTPSDAKLRLSNDSMEIPSHFAEELPRQVLVALANGLQVRPDSRTTTVTAFKNEIVYGETQENARKAAAKRAEAAAAAKRAEAAALKKAQEEEKRRELEDLNSGRKKAAPVKAKEPEIYAVKNPSGAKYGVIAGLCTFFALVIVIAVMVIFNVFGMKDMLFSDTGKKINYSSYVPEDENSKSSKKTPLQYIVDDFTDMEYDDIVKKYSYFEFKIGKKDYHDTISAGNVTGQSVKANTYADKGTVITLDISKGLSEVVLPDFTGMTKADVTQWIAENNVYSKNVTYEEKIGKDSEIDKVIGQDKEAGTKFRVEYDELVLTIAISGNEDTDADNNNEASNES